MRHSSHAAHAAVGARQRSHDHAHDYPDHDPAWHAGRVRTFIGADGAEWTVREVDGARVPAARGPLCLVFESRERIRRVWEYPDDWRGLSAEQLWAVSWRR